MAAAEQAAAAAAGVSALPLLFRQLLAVTPRSRGFQLACGEIKLSVYPARSVSAELQQGRGICPSSRARRRAPARSTAQRAPPAAAHPGGPGTEAR